MIRKERGTVVLGISSRQVFPTGIENLVGAIVHVHTGGRECHGIAVGCLQDDHCELYPRAKGLNKSLSFGLLKKQRANTCARILYRCYGIYANR